MTFQVSDPIFSLRYDLELVVSQNIIVYSDVDIFVVYGDIL